MGTKWRCLPAVHFRKRLHQYIIPGFFFLLNRQVRGCGSVLEFGCGDQSPLRFCDVPYSVGVDCYEPYIRESKAKGIHSEYVIGDIRSIEFKPNSFDCVVSINSIDYITKEEGTRLIGKAETIARKKVIVIVPSVWLPDDICGRMEMPIVKKSLWSVKELQQMGYRVHGCGGWRLLRLLEHSLPKPASLFALGLCYLSEIITYRLPNHDFFLLATKSIGN